MWVKSIKKGVSGALALLLAFAMCITYAPMEAKAADNVVFTVSADKTELHRGDTVKVTVTMSGNESAYGMVYDLIYDEAQLELVEDSAAEGTAFPTEGGFNFGTIVPHPAGVYNSVRATIAKDSGPIANGSVMSMTFKVKTNALKGAVSIKSEIALTDVDTQSVNYSVGGNVGNMKVVVAPTGITLDNSALSLAKGDTGKLTATVDPADADGTVSWSSEDGKVATVEQDGTVTAVGAGKTNIVASIGGKSAKCAVTVTVPLKSISIKSTADTIKKGQTAQLTVVYDPEDTTDPKTVTWSSTGEFATVDQNGLVTAVKDGEETITAKVGSLTATHKITVKEVKLESITVEPAAPTVLRGADVALSVKYNPADTTDEKGVTWKSSNTDIATVDPATGVVTGIKEGTAEITATTKTVSGSTKKPFESTVTVKVTENHLTDDIAGKLAFGKIPVVYKGQTVDILPMLNIDKLVEENKITDDIMITWSSKDKDIISIGQSGKIVGLKEGKATLTAEITATDGSGKSYTYQVSTEIEVKEIPLESIAFDKVVPEMKVGETVTLGILYNPANTTDPRDVEWSSSDESILSVKDGVVKALKVGTAEITAKVGDKVITCKITVKEADKPKTPGAANGSTSNGNKGGNSGVRTGDPANIAVYTILLMISAAVMLILMTRRIYRRNR